MKAMNRKSNDIDLRTLGTNKEEASELREEFAAFEDWNDSALDVYNDYDNAKLNSKEREKYDDGCGFTK